MEGATFPVLTNLFFPGNQGVLYRDAGNITLAIEAYERCLQIDPDSRNAGQVALKHRCF